MSQWPASKARKVYKALLRLGWAEHHLIKGSSHRQLRRPGFADFTRAFHDTDEIGPECWLASPNRPASLPKTSSISPQP